MLLCHHFIVVLHWLGEKRHYQELELAFLVSCFQQGILLWTLLAQYGKKTLSKSHVSMAQKMYYWVENWKSNATLDDY